MPAQVNTSMQMPGVGGPYRFLDYPTLDDDSLVFFGSTAYPTRAGLYHVNITELHEDGGEPVLKGHTRGICV